MSTPATTSALDFDFNEDQRAIADAVDSFCAATLKLEDLKQLLPSFNRNQWQALAQLGVFTPATALGEGGALEICAISESLGRHVFPGPIPATFAAAQLLQAAELESLCAGEAMVSLGDAGECLLPWGQQASLFMVRGADRYHRVPAPERVLPVDTLGGEPWARLASPFVTDTHTALDADKSRMATLMEQISRAAYLGAAGRQLVKESSDYCNTRKQFGKTLGEFQAITHALADCQIALSAAQQLARAAACCVDAKTEDQHQLKQAQEYACAARLSAQKAALQTAYSCHQVYAAIGITLEGPAFHYSRRIRQMCSEANDLASSKTFLINRMGLGLNS